MASVVRSILRHVLGLVLLFGLGMAAGGFMADPVVGQSGCGLETCTSSDGCAFSYNDWFCDYAGGSCLTSQCEDGGPCEGMECET